jgi:F-type H+-transporting ATPase subunit alpha
VLDPLGNPIDGLLALEGTTLYPMERMAPALVQRDFVTQPLYTGLRVIDSMLPIGRGQRELIIGDPSTGKTSIAVDTIINQKNTDVITIYAAIGQIKSRILRIIESVKKYGDFSRTVFVVTDASDSLGFQYITPYSATAIGEYFMDRGHDVLIVYDDLTKHAAAYRSLSLLLKRPPGREAYPGDIFFIHSRLLERSAKLNEKYGGGSITALPIVETQEGKISSYIPTNLISITDGQIYLDTMLFNKGARPAVDVGKSVSRIGGKAQVEAMKLVAEKLKIDYSRFLEVEVFTKFGAHVEEETSRLLRRGERLRELLKQPRFHPFSPEEVILSFFILETGMLDPVDLASVERVCNEMVKQCMGAYPEAVRRIRREGRLSQAELDDLKDFISKKEVSL